MLDMGSISIDSFQCFLTGYSYLGKSSRVGKLLRQMGGMQHQSSVF